MRINVLILLLLWMPWPVLANWTGIAGFIDNNEADWMFNGQAYDTDLTRYGLSIEEKTATEIRVGVSINQFDLRLNPQGQPQNAEKFDGQSLGVYLRLPWALTRHLGVFGQLNYVYHSGQQSGLDDSVSVQWNEWNLDLGVSVRLGSIAIRPFANLRDISGDINSTLSTRLFDERFQTSVGVITDVYLEPTALIRLKITGDDNPALYLGLVREF